VHLLCEVTLLGHRRSRAMQNHPSGATEFIWLACGAGFNPVGITKTTTVDVGSYRSDE
jgi:hypothetical protein